MVYLLPGHHTAPLLTAILPARKIYRQKVSKACLQLLLAVQFTMKGRLQSAKLHMVCADTLSSGHQTWLAAYKQLTETLLLRWRKLWQIVSPYSGIAMRLHLALFYSYGLYYHWSKRATGEQECMHHAPRHDLCIMSYCLADTSISQSCQ